MTSTDVTRQPTDAERFTHILQAQRAAYLRDGAPSLEARRSDLTRFKAALIARRGAIEEAIDSDFGHRSRHETAIMELVGVVQGIDYLQRNLRRFMRPTRCHIELLLPHAQPPQVHLRTRTLERHPPAVRPLRQAHRSSPQLLPPMKEASPAPAGPEHPPHTSAASRSSRPIGGSAEMV
jgi:hypothetical protein